MRRWEAAAFGEPGQVLHLEEVAAPEPGAQEALVRVLTAGVALPDLMMVRGEYPLVPNPPVSPGQEIVGIVERAGEGFPHPAGTRIVGNSRFDIGIGGLAEYTLVPGASALTVMDGLSDEQAVGFPGSFHVAHIGLHHRAHLRAGETLLVVGGAGRTGSAAIQVGKAMGATVIATARTRAKAHFCTAQGADHAVDLGDRSSREYIGQVTNGRGVNVVYDTVGGVASTDATAVLAPAGGRVLVVGFASGQIARLDTRDMIFRDYSAAGVLSTFRTGAERDSTLSALSALLTAGRITPPLTAVYPFDRAPEAITERAANGTGQTVVTVSASRRGIPSREPKGGTHAPAMTPGRQRGDRIEEDR